MENDSLPQTEQPTSPTPLKHPSSMSPLWILLILLALLLVGGGAFAFGKWRSDQSMKTTVATVQATPTPTPTAQTPEPSPSPCAGAPVAGSFAATPSNIDLGKTATLSWGVATNADSLKLDNSIGDISFFAGTKDVTPTKTTTYTLTASCGTQTVKKTVTVTVLPTFAVTGVNAFVDPSSYTGVCPKTFSFTGKITANRAGTVKYKWERNDGSSTDEKTETFATSGTRSVVDSWSRDGSTSGWARVKILSPNAMTSGQANFTLTCQTPGDFSGSWYHNFGTANITQSGTSVTGTYFNGFTGASGTIAGNVSGNTLTGTWAISGGSGTVSWTIDGSNNTFTGSWNGSNNWCGAKSGKQFPDNCGFQGAWNARVGSSYPCSMNLTQTNTSVSGSYCNGTVSGSVAFAGGNEAKLTGNWVIGGTHGNITFYLLGYDGKQFQGNYDTSFRWCGWRSSSSEPGTCLR